MANVAVEASRIPQVFPGTMLKVEEGQSCAVLCAADDEPDGGSTAAAGRPPPPPPAPSPRTATVVKSHHAAAPAASRGGGGGGGGVNSEVASGSCPGEEFDSYGDGYDGADDEDFEDGFADGATATAGDGSSSAGDETETFSELSDPGGTEVVFVREGVAVWPCGARSERIVGRLSLVKQCNVLFMAWLPYSRGVLQEDGTFRVAAADVAATAATAAGASNAAVAATATAAFQSQGGGGGGGAAGGGGGRTDADAPAPPPQGSDRTLYAVHPIPLSEVKALRRRAPPLGLGCPCLVVVLTSGVTLPPLYFQRGGVKAFINTLKQHAFLLKSSTDPHTYLVNDTADPLSRSLSALQLSDVLIGGPPPGASATFKPGEGVVGATPPPAAPPAAWATPTTGLGLAAAAGLGGGGAAAAGRGRSGGLGDAGGGLGLGMGFGLGLGSAVSWCWADQPATAAATTPVRTTTRVCTTAVTGLGGFEAVEGDGGGDEGEEEDVEEDGGGGGALRRQPNAWAYGIVDAINRFVQNVRGTASGWIGALDDLDEQDDVLYGDNYFAGPSYDDTDAAEPRRGEGAGHSGGAAAAATAPSSPPPVPVSDSNSSGRNLPATIGTAAARGGPSVNSGDGGGECTTPDLAAAAAPPPPLAASGGDGSSAVNTAVGDFELLDGGGCWGEAAAHPTSRRRRRPPPLSPEEWAAMFDAEGRLVGEAALRDRVCVSGCAPELRREVWKHLLGMYPKGSGAAQRAETAQKWQVDYKTLRQQWLSMVPGQEARCGSWRVHRTAVDKDVRRTDRGHPFFAREGCSGLRALRNVLLTHVVYDRDLGYCQGMSDLAAPLLVVMRDEAEAFWAFASLMERLGGNFQSDLQGMNLQLGALRRLVQLLDPPLHAFFERRDCLSYYFAFRWLLILFKREFKYDEVLCLWESCWACRRTRHLHLYLAAAVLVQHRRVILSSDLDFDGMLRLSIGLAGRLELQPLLETAEALVGYAGEAGREVTSWLP